MTKAKIAVTLRPRSSRAPRTPSARDARSIADAAAALEDNAKTDDLKAMLDEVLAESGGPLTDRERTAADTALGIAAERKRKRRK